MTPEEWAVLTRAAALLMAQEQIVGTDRTLPVKIDAVLAAKDAEVERLTRTALDESKEMEKLVPSVKRLSEEKGILTVARHSAQRNYEILEDKPKPYIALHGLLTLSRTFRAAVYARWARLLGGGPTLTPSERERAAEVILGQTWAPSKPMLKEAVEAGFCKSPHIDDKFPRLQVPTIEQLLGGSQIAYLQSCLPRERPTTSDQRLVTPTS